MYRRVTFLNSFLIALGALQIKYSEICESHISGTVIYSPEHMPLDDTFLDWMNEEKQDFIWEVSEENAPSKEATLLISLIERKNYLRSDKLTITNHELHKSYKQFYRTNIDFNQIELALNEIKSIVVNMVDEGIKTDIYFIHD